MSWIDLVYFVCATGFGTPELAKNIQKVSTEFNVDKVMILSVISAESSCMPNVMGLDSDTGLMQIVPKWHKDRMKILGVENLFDPESNIRVGSHLLRELKIGDNPRQALAMYNGGYRPPSSSWDYADKIIKNYEIYIRQLYKSGEI